MSSFCFVPSVYAWTGRDTNGQKARYAPTLLMLSRRELLFEHGNACLADAEVLH